MSEMQVPDPETSRPRKIATGLRVVLFVSLAMNLLIVGLVAGFVMRGGPDKAPPRHMRDAVAPYTQALTRKDRRALGRALFREMRSEGSRRDRRARAEAEYREALELLREDPFDATAFAEVLSRQNARAMAFQQRGQRALVEHLSDMSAEDRASFAARVAEALDRRGRR